MKDLKQHYIIDAPVEKVWQALTDSKMIDDWGGGPAQMNDEVGQEWSLWGGDIWGTNTEVVFNKRLVQNWYSDHWPEPSICTFELVENGDETELTLTHTNIPDNEFAEIETGWKDYYLGQLKESVEGNKSEDS